MSFKYSINTNLIFGRGVSEGVGEETAGFGSKAMIVTGGSSVKKSGLLDRVKKQLKDNNVEFIHYDRVQSNPTLSTVEDGAVIAAGEDCDVIVAIGGGSAIDTGKAIAARVMSDIPVEEIMYGGISVDRALPVIAVPTTCGTGTEVNKISVLTNDVNNDKKSIKGDALVPVRSIVDPLLMMTMPKRVFASVSFDAFCHLAEAYLSRVSVPVADMMALHGMKLISENLLKVYNDYYLGGLAEKEPQSAPEDVLQAWENVTFASTLGGYTLNAVGVIAPHALDHPEGGLRNVPHGLGLAAVMPVVLEEMAPYAAEKIADISRIFGGKTAEDCSGVILDLLRKMEIDITMRDLGFEDGDLEWLADNCIKVSGSTLKKTPAPWDREDAYRLFERALDYNRK